MTHPGPDYEDLRWRERLRALELAPQQTPDLWPAIAARLQPHAYAGTVPAAALSTPSARRRRRRGLLRSLLACACLLMLVVLGLPRQDANHDAAPRMAGMHPLDTLLLREADALEREYAAAFAQFEAAPLPTAFQPGLQALALESRRLHAALRLSPQQPRLLVELRRIHERRLGLLLRGAEMNA
jgi:hypothetical protein